MILREAKQVYVPSIHLEELISEIDDMDRDYKINAIKAVRAKYFIGLKDAKDLVEKSWEFLDFVRRIEFPITEDTLDIQTAYGNDVDARAYNKDTYYEDQHDDLPW